MPRVVVIGAGHNGLVCAAYLARAGAEVTVLERRDRIGGACVTEELWPGYKISRAAYVLSLFRPQISRELELERHGLQLLARHPSSATPLRDGRSLVLGAGSTRDIKEIARFSQRDANAYPHYEALLARIAGALEPTLDRPPPDPSRPGAAGISAWWRAARAAAALRSDLPRATRVLLGSASELLNEWFDTEALRATLATDAVIGAFASPSQPGTGYVLFHHVMGSITGERGVWAYVRGGMGSLSQALASAARSAGVTIHTEASVQSVSMHRGRASGVTLENGREFSADAVVSGVDPARSFALLGDEALPEKYARALGTIDYRSPVVKINLALNQLPRFRVNDRDELPLSGTIHVGSETISEIETAYDEASAGSASTRPIVELTIPSTVDDSLAPEGHHVASIFAQYAPARAMDDADWPTLRDQLRDRALALVNEVAPGFSDSIEHVETLVPPDIERIFGLTGGNIFHGRMTPDRLLFMRPVPGIAHHATPIPGFYLCGSGTHPGGGILGAPGRNAARVIARALR